MTIFPECPMAHQWLDGLNEVIEIGASAPNSFGLEGKVGRYRNIDYTDKIEQFKALEIDMCGRMAEVHIVADMGSLPLPEGSVDAYLSSHCIEHTWDPLGALVEAVRVLRPASPGDRHGILYLVVPHPDRCPDDTNEPETMVVEMAARRDWMRWHTRVSDGGPPRYLSQGRPPDDYIAGNRSTHRSFWRPERFRNLIAMVADAAANPVREHYTMEPSKLVIVDFVDIDKKVGNGYTFVLQKQRIDD